MTPSDTAFTPLVVPRIGPAPIDVRDAAERARTRGYAEGFAEGRQLALEEGRRQQLAEQAGMQEERAAFLVQRGAALQALATAQNALDQRTEELSGVAADRIEQLAVELATAILGTELSDPARSAAHALRRALAEMPVDRWTRVALHPQDAALLRDDEGASAVLRGVEVVEAASVDRGGALVSIADGAVDTRIDRALGRAADALRGAVAIGSVAAGGVAAAGVAVGGAGEVRA